MKNYVKLLLLNCIAFPTLVLASSLKPQEFLTFNAWKAQKIRSAVSNHQKIASQYTLESQKGPKGKKSQVQVLGNDLQNAQLAVHTAKNLRLDDYLAVYWAPRASNYPIEKVALGLNPAQIKELLSAYVNSSGLQKGQSFQPLMNERVSGRLQAE